MLFQIEMIFISIVSRLNQRNIVKDAKSLHYRENSTMLTGE